MTVDDLRVAKIGLEATLHHILTDFEERTGLTVQGVDWQRTRILGRRDPGTLSAVTVRATLE